jgi:hypothetical protein
MPLRYDRKLKIINVNKIKLLQELLSFLTLKKKKVFYLLNFI